MIESSQYLLSDQIWDTNFFKIKCGKLTLFSELLLVNWQKVVESINNYDFVTIDNRNSNSANAWFIGENIHAPIVDINIQFTKDVSAIIVNDYSQYITNNQQYDDQIISLSNFEHSRFITDPRLKMRGGNAVHANWVKNAFDRSDKYFVIMKIESSVSGFLLYSFSENDSICTIELISSAVKNKGIGQKMISIVQSHAAAKCCSSLVVGTQISNINAMNFYSKCGFKIARNSQIFHFWQEKYRNLSHI